MVKNGLGRIYIKSFGCPTNLADGEHMTRCLRYDGRKIVEKSEDAEILIYNTCAVKTPTENRMLEMLKKIPVDKKIVVTGCLPLVNLERLRAEASFDCALGSAAGNKIVEAVNRVERGDKIVMLKNDSKPTLDQPYAQTGRVISIIPISYGCLGKCSYCCVRFARGRLRSYQTNEVVKRIKFDIDCGIKEVWLTSQDTACYGMDLGTNLPYLLRRVCSIEGNFFVRVGMMTPNRAWNLINQLIEVFKDKKVFKFLHLPVQSGNDEVLRLMNRMYSADLFRRTVKAFRREISEITIATDVICGFPNESEEAFKHTLELIEEIQPDVINISKFFARPNTPAQQMKPLPNQIVKERSRKMAEMTRRITTEKNRIWLNWEGKVLINEKGKTPSSWIGRNFAYKPTVVKSTKNLLGKIIDVQINKVCSTYLEAEIKI